MDNDKNLTPKIPQIIVLYLDGKSRCKTKGKVYYRDGSIKNFQFKGCEGIGYDFISTQLSKVINKYLSEVIEERVEKRLPEDNLPYGLNNKYVSWGIGSSSIVNILSWLGYKTTWNIDTNNVAFWYITKK